jgi:2-dehydro-3-deoxygluconokinase
MKNFVTFGEIMLRLSPPGNLRFGQARSFDAAYGGGESNVAVSLANYGLPTEFVTRLPANDIGQAALQFLRQFNVGTTHILHGGSRMGVYFMEHGAVMRGSKVIYDRENSSFSSIKPGLVDWKKIFLDAEWFHWTGITPAISKGAAEACLEGVRTAREMGVTVSCDLNFRAKLWNWGKTAGEVMRELVSYCDVVIGNEEDADKVFGIKAAECDVLTGKVHADQYHYVCDELARTFPNVRQIAITLRGSLSASHNTWSGLLWDNGVIFEGPSYDITHIVDRVGGGDSFMGGLIYGLSQFNGDNQKAINFAVAASALKHTIFGDFNLVTVSEVEKLLKGDASGRVSR